MDRQRLRHEDDRSQQAKTEKGQPKPKKGGVPLPQVGQVDERIWASQTTNECTEQENHATNKQSVEQPRPPPVQPLPLVERGKQHCKSTTRIEESCEAWRGTAFLGGRSTRNSVVDTHEHDRREQGGIPKHPVKGKMIAVPAVERRR